MVTVVSRGRLGFEEGWEGCGEMRGAEEGNLYVFPKGIDRAGAGKYGLQIFHAKIMIF